MTCWNYSGVRSHTVWWLHRDACHYIVLCEMTAHISFTDTVYPNLNAKLCDLETEGKDQRPKSTDAPW